MGALVSAVITIIALSPSIKRTSIKALITLVTAQVQALIIVVSIKGLTTLIALNLLLITALSIKGLMILVTILALITTPSIKALIALILAR